jgi:hypothetical protein
MSYYSVGEKYCCSGSLRCVGTSLCIIMISFFTVFEQLDMFYTYLHIRYVILSANCLFFELKLLLLYYLKQRLDLAA